MSRSSVELVRTEGVVVAADAGAVVVAADGSRRLLQVGDTVHPGDLVFTGGKPLIIDFGDDPVTVASNCATCVDGASGTLVAASAETLDVDALQQAILAGVDPTQAFEAAAAGPGGGVGGSGGTTFSVITRDGTATLAEAGFDTSTIETAESVLVNEVVTAPAQTTPEPQPNTAPTAGDLNLTVNEDEVLNGAIVASDLDGDALSFALGTSPTNGSVVLNADGTFTYTPNANYNGSDSFTVTVSDGQGGTVTSTVTIGVTPVNDAPTTSNVSLTTAEDTAVSGAVTGADLDGDALSFVLGTGPTNGSVVLSADGTFTYTPNANYNGSDSFTVTVSDGQGGTVTSTVTIGVTPANDAPTTSNVSLTTAEDTAVNGAVTGADLDGDALSFALGASPTNGSVVLNADGTFTYTPNANYNGSDSFTVTVSDGQGGTVTSTVTIGVTPVNDATVVVNDAVSTSEEMAIDINVLANDSDIDSAASPVVSVTQGANGTVTINVDGTVKYTPNADFTGGDSFTYTNAEGNTATVNVTVNPLNDAPVTSNLNLTTDEDTPVSGAIVASDADGDSLSFSVTGSPANGSVVLNPTTGTFSYTPNANYNGGDSFVVTVSDGQGGTVTSTVTVGVNPLNDAPVAVADGITVAEGGTVTVLAGGATSVLANDTDADGNPLTAVLVSGPANGTLTLNANGTFSYVHDGSETTTDSFTYKVNDGTVDGNTVTVTINVTPVNDAPVAANDSFTVLEDGSVTINVLANDSDVDGPSLTITEVNGTAISDGGPAVAVTNGSVSLVGGQLVFSPSANYDGPASFDYTVSDGTSSVTATVSGTVTPVNDASVVVNDAVSTSEDTAIDINVLANDSDIDGPVSPVASVTQGANGTVSINPDGTVKYTPNANFSGDDSFTYTNAEGNTATVTVTVNPVNDAPVAVADSITVAEGGTVTVLAGGATSVLANDTDADGNPLTAVLVSGPANGTLTLNANGTFSYVHDGSETTTDSFTYKVNDGTADGNTVTVTINVTPVNDATVVVNDAVSTNEDTAIDINVLANDNDIDGPVSPVASVTQGANGTVSINPDGTVKYTPNANFSGDDSFTYTNAEGNTATVTVTVNPANDAPVAVADSITVAEGGTVTVLAGGATSVLANDTDADGNPFTAVLVSGPANGTLTLNANGTFSYVHNGSETTTDSFTYKVNDGTVDGNTVTVSINVTPLNDGPVTSNLNLTTPEDTPVNGAIVASDADGDSLSFSITGSPANGTVVLNPATGTFTYTPNANYNGGDSFVVTVSDGRGGLTASTVAIGVTPVNNAPVAVADSITVAEGGTVTVLAGGATSVLANDTDADGNPLTAVLVSGPANGTLTLNANGTFSYVHNGSETTTDSFTYKVNDGTVDGNTVTVNINVTPVNDAPVAQNDFYTINEDATWSMPLPLNALLTNDSDADGNPLRVIILENAVNGTLSVVGGNVVFTPTAEFSGVASFDYRITDDHGGVSKATVVINVVAVDDPTQAIDDVKTVAEGSTAVGNVLDNDVDPDTTLEVTTFTVNGQAYSANSTAVIPGVGSLSLMADGAYTFTPVDSNFNGAVPTLTYTTNTGASADLNINLTPVNDAPVANDDFFTITANTSLALPMPLSILVANDTDVDGDALRVTLVTSSTNGTLQVVSGNLVFTPTPGFTGVASFNYSVTDDKGGIDSATVNINVVAPPNQAPDTDGLTINGNEDALIAIALSGSDSDGTVAGYTISSLPGNGLLYSDAAMTTLVAVGEVVSGTVYFKPDADWNGSTQFDYAARDDDGLEDVTPATVTINVTPLNDATVVVNDAVSTNEDTAIDINVLANDSDIDGPVSPVASVTQGANGTVTINLDGTVKYTPNANFNGDDSFTYTNAEGNTATVTVTVTPVNDPPTVVAGQSFGYTENMVAGDVIAQVAVTDVDGGATAFRFADSGTNVSADGYFQISNSGVITLTAAGATSHVNDFETGASNTHSYAIEAGTGSSWSAATTIALTEIDLNEVSGLKGEYFAYHQRVNNANPGDGPNLENLGVVENFIRNKVADATFIATNINYGQISGDLGANNKLQTFLGADAPSLSNDPENSSDAIIRMTGVINLDAGSYQFKVTGDDGYSITIDGVVVAQRYDKQSPRVDEFAEFTVSDSGPHSIEIIYWDQGGNAVFQPQIRPAGGSYQPLGGTMLQQADDNVAGTSGNDQLYGGHGDDSLLGGAGADTFIWKEGDEGTALTPAVDRVTDFSVADGDRLDLSDLLQGETLGTIDQYLGVAFSGDDTVLSVSTTAGGSVTQTITLEGWSQSDWQNAYGDASLDAGNLVQKLIDDGKLQIS